MDSIEQIPSSAEPITVDTDLPNKDDIETFTKAAEIGDAAHVEQFLTKWPQYICARDSNSWTALMRAAWFGQVAIVALLIARGAPGYEKDKWNRTAWCLAKHRRHLSIAHMIQLATKKDSAAKGINGFTSHSLCISTPYS